LRAGLLNRTITIQTQPSTAQDAYGAPSGSTTWDDDSRDIPAGIWPLRGDEYHQAAQTQAAVTHKIQMRWMPLADGSAINPKCRIKYHDPELEKDRFFSVISAINVDERNRTLILMTKEEV
jgi:head-tail adaptor